MSLKIFNIETTGSIDKPTNFIIVARSKQEAEHLFKNHPMSKDTDINNISEYNTKIPGTICVIWPGNSIVDLQS
jgi:hypothetical protein